MTDTQNTANDAAIRALTTLSEAAASSANNLVDVHDELADMGRRKRQGWSWRQILSSDGWTTANPLSGVTGIVANLARAAGEFRRALARGLRNEGMRVSDIASLFDVSRQRVSALTRPRSSR
jgi:hypothetical protein